MNKILLIKGTSNYYEPNGETFTVNQLIEKLEEFRDCDGAGDSPVYLCNDNGYTYGEINEDTLRLKNHNG